MFQQRGLIPVIARDKKTGEVLMPGYADQKAIGLTRSSGFDLYYHIARKKIWKKGKESGIF